MKNKKLTAFAAAAVFAVIFSLNVTASDTEYIGEYIDFEDGISGWSYLSGTDGTIRTGIIDEDHGNSVSMTSSGALTTYRKNLDNPISAKNAIYELSYDLYIPHIYTGTSKQTVSVIGRASNTIPAFYSLRIDNGIVSYYNGKGKYDVSTAYKNGEKLTVTEGEWHRIKTVYNRMSEVFTYYIDGEPLLTEKGDIIRVKPFDKTEKYTIAEFNLMMRSTDGYEMYVDNISVCENPDAERKSGVYVYDFSLANQHGLEADISDISDCTKLTASIEYEAYDDFVSVVALYCGNTLKNVYSKKTEVSKNGFISTDSFEIAGTDGADRAKLFVLDSFEKITPYKFTAKSENSDEISIRLDGASACNDDITAQRTQKDLTNAYIMNEGFGRGTENWERTSAAGTMTAVKVDDRHGTSITINSDHTNKAVFKKQIKKPIKADNRTYSLSYSINIPEVKTAGSVQSVEVTGQNSAGTDSFWTMRVDNGYVRYYDGTSESGISDGYDANGNKLTVPSGKWQILKTVYDRMTGTFTYFFNRNPVYDADGNIAKARIYNSLAGDEITQVAIFVKNADDSDVSYIDNLAIAEEEILTAEKASVTGVLLKAPVMDYDTAAARKKKYDSTLGGPVETCYINFTVNNKAFTNRADGNNYEIEVEYYDEGYGCFTLEYDTYHESLKEAEYVNLQNTCEWKTYTFRLENVYFTGSETDFRLATWGEKMRYSNTDVVFSNVCIKNSSERNQYEIKSTGSAVGNIYYTGERPSFNTEISNRNYYEYSSAFGTYEAILKYSILDENKKLILVTGIEKITVNPISTVTSGISFDIDEYGLYYLRTEVICHEHSIYAVDDTEFSYVNSDRQTVNPDFGTSAQVLIFSDSVSNEESIAKNAGIGMIRWVRSMSDVMNLTYGENSQTLTKKGFGAWKKYDEIFRNNGYTLLNCLLAGNMVYSDETKNGYKLHIPYGDTGKDLFAEYCRYFAENAPAGTKYYEIWNEFDSPAGTSFNMNGEDLKNYGNLLVKAADEIYAADDDAEIVSVVSSHARTHERVIERVKSLVGEENLQKYFKNASVHPYHWNDNPLFCENTVTGEMTDMYKHLKEIRDVYDNAGLTDTKLWVSEVAWSPGYTDYNDVRNYPNNTNISDNPSLNIRKPITEKQQGSYLVQTYVMLKKNNLVEKYIPFLFSRQTDARADRDKNMGIIKSYNGDYAKVPYAATSAYLAVSNLNMLLTGAEYIDDFVFDGETAVAYRYLRSNGDDIAILWSALEDGEKVSVNLGCGSITVYDEYGNSKIRTSSDGTYEFDLTQSTVYVTGSFTAFERR